MRVLEIVDGTVVSVLENLPDTVSVPVTRILTVTEKFPISRVELHTETRKEAVIGEDGLPAIGEDGAPLFREVEEASERTVVEFEDRDVERKVTEFENRPSKLSDFWHPDLLERFVEYSGPAEPGWHWDAKKQAFVAPPDPGPGWRVATAKQLRYALNASGQRAAWDTALAAASADTRDYWEVEPNPPETSAKLKRLAKSAGVDLAALFDASLTA